MKKQNLFNKVMARKIYIAKVGVPVWATALGAGVIGATAGQGGGPTLSGGAAGTTGLAVGGDGGLTLSQSIVLAYDSMQNHTVSGGQDGVIAVSDDGTSFTVAVEAFEDQPVDVNLDLVNESSTLAFAQMTCVGPTNTVTIDIEEFTGEADGVEVARQGRDTWLMKVPDIEASSDEDVAITLSGKAGFHTIRCSIKQISG